MLVGPVIVNLSLGIELEVRRVGEVVVGGFEVEVVEVVKASVMVTAR